MAEYIEREALIKKCKEIIADECFIDDIENQPAADVQEVRHGKWAGTVCTNCGESTSFYYDCDYCPQCGAKMDKESE